MQSSLENVSAVLGGTHQVDRFDDSLEAENSASILRLMPSETDSSLLQCDRVVSRCDFSVQNVEISTLLSLDGESMFVEVAHLHGHLRVEHIHTHLEVHSGSHINSEVVSLKNGSRPENRWRHLDQWVIIEKLVSVSLLLLTESKREVGSLAPFLNKLAPCVIVSFVHIAASNQNCELSSWWRNFDVLASLGGSMSELDLIGASVEILDQRVARATSKKFAVSSRDLSEGKSKASVLDVNLDSGSILLDGERNTVLAFLVIELDGSGEKKVMRVIKSFSLIISLAAHELVGVEIERESAGDSWAVLVLCLGLVNVLSRETWFVEIHGSGESFCSLVLDDNLGAAALGFGHLSESQNVSAWGKVRESV